MFWAPPIKADGSGQATPADFLGSDSLVAPAIETLLLVEGEGVESTSGNAVADDRASSLVHNVTVQGLTLGETLPTFMQPYEPTSGGDW